MSFLRDMISGKSSRKQSADGQDFDVEGLENDQETLRGVHEHLAQSPEAQSKIEDGAGFEDKAGFEDDDGYASNEGVVFGDADGEFDVAELDDENLDDEAWGEDFDAGFDEKIDDETPDAQETAADLGVGDTEPALDITGEGDEDAQATEETAASFEDNAEEAMGAPLPKISEDDIQRAMKLRKKMWSDVPKDEELVSRDAAPAPAPAPEPTPSDLESYRPVSRTVTRPTSRSVGHQFSELGDLRKPATEPTASDYTKEAKELPGAAPETNNVPKKIDVAEVADTPHLQTEIAEADAVEAPEIPEIEDTGQNDDATIQSLMEAAAAANAAEPQIESDVDLSSIGQVPTLATGRVGQGAGRVKTRLLGFQPGETDDKDIFDAKSNQPTQPDQYPVGWFVVVQGSGRGSSFSLHAGVSLIGRGEDQAVRLNFGDTSISRDNHASVAFDDEQNKFYLGHGGKSNIVRLNDKPVLSTEELLDGDVIRIGETTLRFTALCGSDFNWTASHGGETGHAAIA